MGAETGIPRSVQRPAHALDLLRTSQMRCLEKSRNLQHVEQRCRSTHITLADFLYGRGKFPGAVAPQLEACKQLQKYQAVRSAMLTDPYRGLHRQTAFDNASLQGILKGRKRTIRRKGFGMWGEIEQRTKLRAQHCSRIAKGVSQP